MAEHITPEAFLALPVAQARAEYLRLRESGEADHAEQLRARYWETNKVSIMDGVNEVAPKKGGAAERSNTDATMGWLFLLGGLALALYSFAYDPSVATSSSLSTDLYSVPDRVVNNGKLNIQLMMCVFGSALAICGSVFLSRSSAKCGTPGPPVK